MTHIDPSASGLCTDPGCRVHSEPSVPRTAADGLRLCGVHTRRLGENVLSASVRHHELELRLAPTGSGFEPVSGSTADRNARVNQAAIDTRSDIVTILNRLTATIVTARGFGWPTEWHMPLRVDGFIGPLRPVSRTSYRVPVLARFVARSTEWLAARPDAGVLSWKLQTIVNRAQAAAYPAGVKQIALQTDGGYVGCFEPDCPGFLWAVVRPGSGRSEWVCNFEPEHVTPQSEWVRRWSERYGSQVRTEAA